MNITALLLISIFSFFAIQLNAQEIEIRMNNYNEGEYTFKAINHSQRPYFVVLAFKDLLGACSDTPGHVHRVDPGVEEKMCEVKSLKGSSPFSSYGYRYFTSNPSARIDPEFPYLIPVKDGFPVQTLSMSNISALVSRGTPANWYCIGFKTNDGDTICSSRGGIVVESSESEIGKDLWFNRDDNFISILHDDGTIARYSGFEINQVFPKIGERVIASQPLGIVSPAKSNTISHFSLTVYRSTIDGSEMNCVLTKFCVLSIKPEILLPNNKYVAHHFSEVITKEMSRKMKKKFLGE